MQPLPQQTCLITIARKQIEAQALAQDVDAFLAGRVQPSALAALSAQEAKTIRERKIKHAVEDARQAKPKKIAIVKTKTTAKPASRRYRSDQNSDLPVSILTTLITGPKDSRLVCQQVAAEHNVQIGTVQSMIKRMIDRCELVDRKISTPTSVTRVIATPSDNDQLAQAAEAVIKTSYQNHFAQQIEFIQSVGWVSIKQVASQFNILPSHARQLMNILLNQGILERQEQSTQTGMRWMYCVKESLS